MLGGPVDQIKQQLPGSGAGVRYCVATKRGADVVLALFDVADWLFAAGSAVNLACLNQYPGADDSSQSHRPTELYM